MHGERINNVAFRVGFISSMTLIAAMIVGVFYSAETFATQYSALAGRSLYLAGR